METLKERQQKYIDDFRYQKWEAGINLKANEEILPDMEDIREKLQNRVKMCQERIEELEKDPSREARDKRKKEEEELKKWSARLEFQNIQIDGGELYNKETGKKERIDGVIQQKQKLETTIKNLSIFIKVAEKHK